LPTKKAKAGKRKKERTYTMKEIKSLAKALKGDAV
jgi:hypothetical protein